MKQISGSIKRVKRWLTDTQAARKFVAAVFVASSVLSSLSPAVAYAAESTEPETATVTLLQTENGALSFDGTDDQFLKVEVGSEVTVNATPDDGYFADSLSVFTSDNEAESVEVKDGKATFAVNGDVTVTAAFYENGSSGSSALNPVTVSEQAAVTSVEDYIRANADPQYVGEGEELSRKDVLTVTTTVVDGSKLPDATLDALWEDTDGDGMSDNYTSMLSQAVSHAVLFEVDPEADYYVGWAGADIEGASLTDWAAAENNADAVMREGFVMDAASGLVYVPKSYTETNDEGEPMVASSRIQLLYTTQDASATATFDFSTNVTDVDGNIPDAGKVSTPVTSVYTRVTLADDSETRDAVHTQTIDSVTVNGIEYTPDMDMWTYDAETGVLEFKMAPAGIHAMTVNMSNNFGKDAAAFFGLTAQQQAVARSASVNNIGTWEFDSAPYAGQSFVVSAHNTYGSTSGSVHPAVENPSGGNYENKTIYQALGTQSVDVSALQSGNWSILRTSTIHQQSTDVVTISNEVKLGLTCGHVGVNQNFQLDSGYNEGAAMSDDFGAHIYVVSVSGNTAIIGVTVPTSHTQAGGGFFEINWKVSNGSLNIQKTSGNASITDGNSMYSLEGAEFTVYDSTGAAVATLTTDASGATGTVELPLGTYTVRETKAPEGYLTAADQTVVINSGSTATLTFADTPANDPVAMLVGKYDGDSTYTEIEGNMPQGSASLEGAEFTVEYYATLDYDSYDALKDAGMEPTRSWVFSTDSDGYAYFSEEYLISGDAFYYDSLGAATMPRGTVVVYESKAPEGYNLNTDVSFQKIQEDWTSGVVTYNTVKVPETVARGGVAVQKLDSETGKVPQGGADLSGITFSIINDSKSAVVVDGTEYQPGQVVKTITTDESGYAATADDALPYGDYIIRETSTNEFYLNTSEDIHVTISENGAIYDFTATDDIVRGGVEVYKSDFESGLSTPLGAASIDGTTFEVKSLNDNPVIVDGVTYGKGDVVATLVIEDGHASTSSDSLPAGTYSLQEVKAGEGYNLTDGTAYEFTISEDGAIVNPVTGEVVRNQVKRSDLEFSKKADDTADRLAGVAFKVTSLTTGESHIIVTDENGYFSSASSWNAHTQNTNGNDWALDAEGTIDSSQLDVTAGVWFGLTAEGSMTDPDDSLGALPYDTYAIEELRCTANEGYQLIETTVTISRDGATYDFGTLDDIAATITTNAYDPVDGDGYVGVGEIQVADKVTYSNVIKGREYTIKGELHDAETGDVLTDSDGNPVTMEKTFTAESSSGYEVMEFTLSTFELGGKTIVVYEYLYDDGGSLIASHEDKGDVDQQVTVIEPEIGTTAADGLDGDKNVITDDQTTVVDTVSYKNLIPGKEYTVTGTLMVKGTDADGNVTEEALLDADGNPVTAETTFTPETADGTVDVTFTFDSRYIEGGTELVAFESLELSGIEVAVHADIEDYAQTVTVDRPEIGTTAADGHDGDKNVVADTETTVVDTVSYKNLIPGKEYTVTGTLMVKGTDADGNVTEEALLDADGNPVTAETTFTPEAADGTVDVTFTFDSSNLPDGTELVAFESLERVDVELAAHADINDESQTVTVYETTIGTTAADGLDGDKTVIADAETTVTDTVAYNDTLTGTLYTMAGILMDAETGLPILTGDGSDQYTDEDVSAFMDALYAVLGLASEESESSIDMNALTELFDENADLVSHMVYQSEEFVPVSAAGTVDMDFDFNANDVIDRLSGETKDVVVFEVLFKGSFDVEDGVSPVVVASELDLENEEQTVIIIPSVIGTTATDASDGDHELMAGQDAVITDTVTYEGLIPGEEYTLKATLYDKETGEPLSVGDKHVTAELRFTPNSESGTVDIDLGPFDASELDGHDLVVFEELYKQSTVDGETTDVLVAEHKDIEDEDQTVTVTSAPSGSTIEDGGYYGKTGGSNVAFVAVIILLVAAAGGLGYYGLKAHRAAKHEGEVDTTTVRKNDGTDA